MKKLILLSALILTVFINAYSQHSISTYPISGTNVSYNLVGVSDTSFLCTGWTDVANSSFTTWYYSSVDPVRGGWKIIKGSDTIVVPRLSGISTNNSTSLGTVKYTVSTGYIYGNAFYTIEINKSSSLDGVKVGLYYNIYTSTSPSALTYIIYKTDSSIIQKLRTDTTNKGITIRRLQNDSSRLMKDSINYLTRISKLSNDSIRLTNDSINYLASITFLKSDTTTKGISLTFLKTDTTNKGLTIAFLQNDTTNKGIIIRQLQTDLANKHDTVYIASVITSDTLKISIHTGISSASPTINSLKVYPNPASTLLHIDLEKSGYFTAKISGITGQLIITPTSGTIDISGLANGTYILTIYDSNGKLISTNKILIAK